MKGHSLPPPSPLKMEEMRISDIFQSVEPELMDEYVGTSAATTIILSPSFPQAIRRLPTRELNTEINNWINNTITNTDFDVFFHNNIFRPTATVEKPRKERDVERHLEEVILNPCLKMIRPGICKGFNVFTPGGMTGADYCWTRSVDDEKEPLFIEVKTPMTMSETEHIPDIIKERSNLVDLVENYKRSKVDTQIDEGNESKIIRQIWKYFRDSACQYGILTNGFWTIFMRRIPLEPKVLFISEAFPNSSLKDSLSILARYSYFFWKARDAPPILLLRTPTPSPESPYDDDDQDPHYTGSQDDVHDPSGGDGNRSPRRSERIKKRPRPKSQSLAGGQQAFFPLPSPPYSLSSSVEASHGLTTHGVINRGNCSCVRHADYDGRKVVAKLSFGEVESNQIVQQEGEKYKELGQLQGKAIPRVISQFTDQLCMYIIVMEPLLRIETWTQATVDKACASLTALHALGYVHGDISKSNFMQNEDGHVFVIDLEHAEWSATIDATFTGEHAQVRKFLKRE